MTTPSRLLLAGVVLSLVAAGCATTGSGPSRVPGASGSAAPSPSSVASVSPTTAPSVASSSTPSPTVAPSVASCDALPQTVLLPSDRFTDLSHTSGASADRLTFVFGNPSLPGPAGPPKGALEVAESPYTLAGSGATIDVFGEHVVQVRFSGMSLSNDVGQPTYAGPAGVEPDLRALRHAVMFDASEGVIGWYVGYDGSGCLTLVRDGNEVTLVIEHR